MAIEDLSSEAQSPRSLAAPVPRREPFWLLALGIAMFTGLLLLTWWQSSARTSRVSYLTVISALHSTYAAEYLLYRQQQGCSDSEALESKMQKQAIAAGYAWRRINATARQANAQALRRGIPPYYSDEYIADTDVNVAALFGAAGYQQAASIFLASAAGIDPVRADAYLQLQTLFKPDASAVSFSAETLAVVQRMPTGPLLRARNAELAGNQSAELVALLPGQRAGRRGVVAMGIIGVFFGAVLLAFAVLLILLIINWRRIAQGVCRVVHSVPEETPWGVGSALLAISAVFMLSRLLTAVLMRLFNVPRINSAMMATSGMVEIICALVVFGIFLLALGKSPFAWGTFGWHAEDRQIGYGLATFVLVFPLEMGLLWLSVKWVHNISDNPVLPALGNTTNPWFVLAIVSMAVVMAPLVEETLFRGLLYRALAARLPFWAAAGISGLLFAAGHGELVVILPFTLIGIAFAYLNRKTGNLWTTAVAHGAVNALASCAVLLLAWATRGPGS